MLSAWDMSKKSLKSESFSWITAKTIDISDAFCTCFCGDMCSNRKRGSCFCIYPDVIICRKTANLICFAYAVFWVGQADDLCSRWKRNWQNTAATAPHSVFSHLVMSSQVMISGHFNRLSFKSAGFMNSPVWAFTIIVWLAPIRKTHCQRGL